MAILYNHSSKFLNYLLQLEEIRNYLLVLTDVNSPVYLIILFTFFLFVSVFQLYKIMVIPRIKAHQKEKEELLSLFALLDPDPLIRFDKNGIVIKSNDSALKIYKSPVTGKNIKHLLKNLNANPQDLIEKNFSFSFVENIHEKSFVINVKPIPSLGVGQFYFTDITENLEKEKKLLEYQDKLKDYADNLQSYIEDEKSRIAQDLHDSIGQQLILLKLKLQKSFEGGRNAEDELSDSVEETLSELKDIIYNLKPKVLEEMGLPAALNNLIDTISSEAFIKGNFELIGERERFPSKIELLLFRIAQEALNNIVKHSGADVFYIQLLNSHDKLKLIISDNGIGFDSELLFKQPSSLKGFGLLNIKEKVERCKGTFRLSSYPGEGTVLIIQLNKKCTNERSKSY